MSEEFVGQGAECPNCHAHATNIFKIIGLDPSMYWLQAKCIRCGWQTKYSHTSGHSATPFLF